MIWRRPEPETVTEEDGIPQPMVDQALEEEAWARGEFPPPAEPEAPVPPLRERLLLKDPRRVQIIAAVLIIAIIIIAVLWPGGPGGGNGNGGPEEVVIEELSEFTWTVSTDEYLLEGEDLYIDAFVDFQDNPTSAIFVNTVTVTVTWADEPDAGILWTNTPDEISALVDDNMDIDTARSSGQNPQGGRGNLVATWSSGTAWVVTGNPDLVDWGDQEVYEDVTVMAGASMDRAGDQVTPLGRTQADPGNAYTITYAVSGRSYTAP